MAFQAQYVGICGCGCGMTIDREDWIEQNDEGRYVIQGHEVRADAPVVICKNCYVAKSATGACNCF